MHEPNLFEIRVRAPEREGALEVNPTPWLTALPPGFQVTEVKRYLRHLKEAREGAADAGEQVRLAAVRAAAVRYLDELGD